MLILMEKFHVPWYRYFGSTDISQTLADSKTMYIYNMRSLWITLYDCKYSYHICCSHVDEKYGNMGPHCLPWCLIFHNILPMYYDCFICCGLHGEAWYLGYWVKTRFILRSDDSDIIFFCIFGVLIFYLIQCNVSE